MEEKTPFSEWLNSLIHDETVMIAPLYRLSDMDPEEWRQFRAVWPTLDDERRRVIVRHLADISEDVFHVDFSDTFAMGLKDEFAAVRLASLDGLYDSEDISLIRPIITMMESDPDLDVRAKAARNLGHFIAIGEWEIIPQKETEPIVEALLKQLDDPNTAEDIRRSALESIGSAYHPRVSELIKVAYDTGKYMMQISAVTAMGNSADSRWTSVILDEFEHPDAEMRFMAARAAGQIGSSDFVEGLILLTDDEDLEVQLVSIASLGEIGGDVAREALEALADDPELDDGVQAVIEDALEELTMMSGFGDLSLLNFSDDEEMDETLDGNWLPFNGEA